MLLVVVLLLLLLYYRRRRKSIFYINSGVASKTSPMLTRHKHRISELLPMKPTAHEYSLEAVQGNEYSVEPCRGERGEVGACGGEVGPCGDSDQCGSSHAYSTIGSQRAPSMTSDYATLEPPSSGNVTEYSPLASGSVVEGSPLSVTEQKPSLTELEQRLWRYSCAEEAYNRPLLDLPTDCDTAANRRSL